MNSRRTLAITLFFAVLLTSGCGGGLFFINTGSNGTDVLFVSGLCTAVQLTNVVGPNGSFITVTAVTLLNGGFSSSYSFCGNVVGQFPLNNMLNVHYTNGAGCSTLTSIVIIG